jgi:hypothetical protein
MKLHEQVEIAKLRAAEINRQVQHFRAYLAGPKFSGHDPRDGYPNDYINVREVDSLLVDIVLVLDGALDDCLLEQKDE